MKTTNGPAYLAGPFEADSPQLLEPKRAVSIPPVVLSSLPLFTAAMMALSRLVSLEPRFMLVIPPLVFATPV